MCGERSPLVRHGESTGQEASATYFQPFPLGEVSMPTPFFQRLQLQPIYVAFEEIVPAASTPARVRQRAVYKDLIHKWPHFLNDAVRDTVESRLRPYRQRTWEGHLDTEDFRDLLHVFLAFKADFRRHMDAFEAYAMIKCCAALLAQMLFVDNCLKEAVSGVSHPDNQETVARLVRHLQDAGRILFGEDDRLLDYRKQGETMKASCPALDLELIDGGHMLPMTAPDRCAAFIRRIAARQHEVRWDANQA